MNTSTHAIRAFALALTAGLLLALLAPLATRPSRAAGAGRAIYVSPGGSDASSGADPGAPLRTIQRAVDLAQPGDVITLAPGSYLQDIISRRSGTPDAPITIAGPADAVVKGGGNARIVEIRHDYLTLDGFTIDGLWGAPDSAAGYRDKLLYAIGSAPLDGVNGLRLLRMTFRNAGGECVRLRYFAQHNEVAFSTFRGCGVHDFRFGAGGKNGEAIYIGTAPEQRGDGKNPTADPDQSNANWVHDNSFDTQGNECVDIKEAATGNLVERNSCTGQQDPDSGGFDSRGSGNVFRANTIFGNRGAGVRLGGDASTDGIDNDVYANVIRDNRAGGIAFQRAPQRRVCGNSMANNSGGDAVGSYGARFSPAAACDGAPQPTSTAAPAPSAVPTSTAAPSAVPTSTAAPTPAREICGGYALDGAASSFIEAERYSGLGGRFALVADAQRSGGQLMAIPGSGMAQDPRTFLSFSLSVSHGGTFYVWLLGSGRDGSSDSFFLQADGGALVQANLVQGGWGWKRAGATLTLADGAHRLLVQDREDGARLDKILLTKDKALVPSGLGGAALRPGC